MNQAHYEYLADRLQTVLDLLDDLTNRGDDPAPQMPDHHADNFETMYRSISQDLDAVLRMKREVRNCSNPTHTFQSRYHRDDHMRNEHSGETCRCDACR